MYLRWDHPFVVVVVVIFNRFRPLNISFGFFSCDFFFILLLPGFLKKKRKKILIVVVYWYHFTTRYPFIFDYNFIFLSVGLAHARPFIHVRGNKDVWWGEHNPFKLKCCLVNPDICGWITFNIVFTLFWTGFVLVCCLFIAFVPHKLYDL